MRSIVFFAFALPLVACGGTPASVDPTISISSPANNSTVAAPTDGMIPVEFSTNYLLKPTGQCDGQSHCGAVYLLIDNTECDSTGNPYNAFAVTSPTSVNLGLCATQTGQHKITAELHNDDGTIVDDNITKDPVTATVTITLQ